MQDKVNTLKKIDAAIDAMDESELNAGLEVLANLVPESISAEDAKLFAARIQKINKGKTIMRKPINSIRIAIVAAVVLAMGITAYATGVLNIFSFQQDDKFVTFRTTENMTEQDAKDFVGEDVGASVSPEAVMQANTEDFTFESVEQAAEKLEIAAPIPSAMPEMKLDSADGTITNFGDNLQMRTLWLNYSDDTGRMFGITIVREIMKPGSSVTGYTTTDIDDGSLSKYKSKSGIEYTTLTESDDTGEKIAHIATTVIGEYEYSLIFLGFDEAERQAIIDSADLSVYK